MLTLRSYIYPILFASLHFSFLGFGWKRVAINSGPKNPKDLLKKRRVSRHKCSTKPQTKFDEAPKPRLPDPIVQPIGVMPPSRMLNPTLAMSLIEDLSRYGIEDCSYSPEVPKSNAYSTIMTNQFTRFGVAKFCSLQKPSLKNDEAHFWLNGYVNKQNCRIWSEANPQVYVETPLHPEKLTVWCALWAGGILLQKR
ncbi:hypothetical protein TNCV_1172771 [Trichonephila clavipes]|uniref:Uncharacterized protein n=1 Tax=Trichonephila clavipes TaxID=2585209 RepID=A0A8X6V8K1_TRICX|nr:hypothetical protein TNCV_1172771 [Trichonephila clavipes]